MTLDPPGYTRKGHNQSVQDFSYVSTDTKVNSKNMSMVIDFMLRENALQEMLMPNSKSHGTVCWIIYYLTSLLQNAFIISLYIVQVFTKHEDCFTTRKGKSINLLHDMQLSFYIGLSVIVVETINCGVVSIYVRFRTSENSQARLYSQMFEWIMRVVIIGVAILQLRML